MVNAAFNEVAVFVGYLFEFLPRGVDIGVGLCVVFKYPFGDVDCSFIMDVGDVVGVVIYDDVEVFVFYCAVFSDGEKVVGCDVRVLCNGNVHFKLLPMR